MYACKVLKYCPEKGIMAFLKYSHVNLIKVAEQLFLQGFNTAVFEISAVSYQITNKHTKILVATTLLNLHN